MMHQQLASTQLVGGEHEQMLYNQDSDLSLISQTLDSAELFNNVCYINAQEAEPPPDTTLSHYAAYTPALSIIMEETESQLDMYYTNFGMSRSRNSIKSYRRTPSVISMPAQGPQPGAFFKQPIHPLQKVT